MKQFLTLEHVPVIGGFVLLPLLKSLFKKNEKKKIVRKKKNLEKKSIGFRTPVAEKKLSKKKKS